MSEPSENHSRKFLTALAMPVITVVILAIGIMLIADRFLHHALNHAILRFADDNAQHWAEDLTASTPEVAQLVAGERSTLTDLAEILDSAEENNIFRFKVFAPDGETVFISDEPDYLLEPPHRDTTDLIQEVIATGVSYASINDGTENPNRPDAYVETYMQARGADGTPFGVIEVYVDTSDLSNTFHGIFHVISRALVLGTAVVYLIPSLFVVLRSEKLRALDRALLRLSTMDPLTNTLNRRAFTSKSAEIFAKRRTESIGVLFIDLDRFKEINDSLGHSFGDSILEQVARDISRCLRPEDVFGRFGGDEFIVLLPDCDASMLTALSRRLKTELTRTYTHQGSSLALSVSIGSHLSPPGESEERARHSADLALYRAKADGRGQIVQFSEELDERMRRRRHIEASIRKSLSGDSGFSIQFQPIFTDSRTTPAGFEALLRLQDAEGQNISPMEFIPIAEESGLIVEVGQVSMKCALETALGWQGNPFLSINLSAVQFKDGQLVDQVRDLLRQTGFDPTRLHFEVTESLLIEDEEAVSEQLVELQNLGISISLDDFGTGYSSLAYLWKFQFDNLKIDRAFLAGLNHSSDRNLAVIKTVVALGHSLGMSVTVEGVETEEQFEAMKTVGCDRFQGYLLGRPLDLEAANALTAQGGSQQWRTA